MTSVLNAHDVLADVAALPSGAAAFVHAPRLLAPRGVPPELRELVAAHRAAGHLVVLVAADDASDEDVAGLVGALPADDTLLLHGDAPPEEQLRSYAHGRGIDLASAATYAGCLAGLPLLAAVGHPRPVDPEGDLSRAAGRAGWPVFALPSRSRPGAEPVLRTAAAYASLLPSMLGGVAVGLLNRDRTQIVQHGIGTWVDRLFAYTGVTVRVAGEENLWSHRPAVFVYNHRNNFDPYVVIRLVRRDWGAVGKKELAGPFSPLAQWATPNVAYVDRSRSDRAIASLQPVTELLRRGVSVVVAPEGTRSRTGHVGVFKRGPFHMAREAGVPVVPVVIRNADAVADRGATVIRSGTVDVAVLPAVDVLSWPEDQLTQCAEQVRVSFVQTLADWPAPGEARESGKVRA